MGGGLLQLVAYGAQDVYLTGNPQITFFKAVYRRHTNFALEAIEQTFNGNPGFGSRVTCQISRNGDLINRVYLQLRLTGSKYCKFFGLRVMNYVEIDILNPFNRVMAFEFKVNGLSQIDSVVSLIPGFNPLIRFGQDGQIVGLDSSENYIERKYNPTPFIRIYYSGVDSNNICIGEITAFVNDVYEETDKHIGNNCATFVPSSTVQQQTLMPKIKAVPNPFDSKTTIYIEQEDNTPFELYVTDIMGQKVAEFRNVLNNQIQLDREGWSAGVYFVHLNKGGKIISTKIVAK